MNRALSSSGIHTTQPEPQDEAAWRTLYAQVRTRFTHHDIEVQATQAIKEAACADKMGHESTDCANTTYDNEEEYFEDRVDDDTEIKEFYEVQCVLFT